MKKRRYLKWWKYKRRQRLKATLKIFREGAANFPNGFYMHARYK